MKNYILSALGFLLLAFNLQAEQAYSFSSNGVLYEQIDPHKKEVRVVGLDGYSHNELIIPPQVKVNSTYYHVVAIGDSAFIDNKTLQIVMLPNGLRWIERYAFAMMDKLTTIEFPPSLERIDDYGFFQSYELGHLEIPERVQKLGEAVFTGCKSVVASKDHPTWLLQDGLLTNLDRTTVYYAQPNLPANFQIPSTIDSIQPYTFYQQKRIQHIKIPDDIQYIPYAAFSYCENLQTVELPNSLLVLGDYAFSQCLDLRTMTIPHAVYYMGNRCFSNCRNLLRVQMPTALAYLGNYAFSGCNLLMEVELPRGLKYIGDGCFSSCNSLLVVDLPESLEAVGDTLFMNCTRLKDVRLPSHLTKIGVQMFSGCKGLMWVDIPKGVKSIERRAFFNCVVLKRITIPTGCDMLGVEAFQNCEDLERVALPDSLLDVGDGAFYNCKSLRYVSFGKKLARVGSRAFGLCGRLQLLTLPHDAIAWGESCLSGVYGLSVLSKHEPVELDGLVQYEWVGEGGTLNNGVEFSDNTPFTSTVEFYTHDPIRYTCSLDVSGEWQPLMLPFATVLPERTKEYQWGKYLRQEGNKLIYLALKAGDLLESGVPYIVRYIGPDSRPEKEQVVFENIQGGWFTPMERVNEQGLPFEASDRSVWQKGGMCLQKVNYRLVFAWEENPWLLVPYRYYYRGTQETPSMEVKLIFNDVALEEQQGVVSPQIWSDNGLLYINLSSDYQLQIHDMQGRLIYSERYPAGNHQIDHLPKGIYLVEGKKIVL